VRRLRLRSSFFPIAFVDRKQSSLLHLAKLSHHRLRERVQRAGPVERRDAQGAAALEKDLEEMKGVLEEEKGWKRHWFFVFR